MGRITTNIGLITGLPITDTVDQLISIEARPRDLLISRTNGIRQQQVAVTQITALLTSIQFTVKKLADSELFQQRKVSTSNTATLTASVTGSPSLGTSVFTPLKIAQAHQLVSDGVASANQPLGAGSLTIRYGGFVDQGISLDLLNGGSGFTRGKIRITDRSGASEDVDLRFAQSVDDILETINQSSTISVSAVAVGDKLRLIDLTGQTTANLRVQEVGSGTTAASLGLGAIDVAANQADGSDVFQLFNGISLDQLNDGAGIGFDEVLSDLSIQFQDGTTRSVDFRPLGDISLYANGTSTAVAGVNGQVTFTASTIGSVLAGVSVIFQDDVSVTAGAETVVYDSGAKTLTFKIDEGVSTAAQVTAALNADGTANAFFTASLVGDGSGVIDVADTATTALATVVPNELTLGDVLASLNAVAPSKLTATLSAGGDSIVLTDLTSGGSTFGVTSQNNSTALADLGLTNAQVGGVITGNKLVGGLKTTLLSNLNGGAGLGTLGAIDLTDRSGATETVDLSSAVTLDDVIETINGASVGITATINQSRNGIVLTDSTGATTSNLIVANGDGTNSADALSIAVNAAVTTKNSGNLTKQTVGRGTRLDTFNGGAGVANGSIRVVTSDGGNFTVNLSSTAIETVGDVIDRFNSTVTGATAQINETGDGILIIDSAEGGGTLKIEEIDGTTAADLHIEGEAVSGLVGGAPKSIIDGTTTFTVQVSATDTLADLVTNINALKLGVVASQFSDGSAQNPLRLTLASGQAGKAGELLIDASGLGFGISESVKAQDSLLLFGSLDDNSVGVVVSSKSTTFTDLVPGVSLTVQGASTTAVSVTVSSTDTDLVATAIALVDSFNRLRDKIDEVTFFDAISETSAILQGDNTVLRVEIDLSRLFGGLFLGAGSIKSLETVGISLTDKGQLILDQDVLKAKFAEDPTAVEALFTTKNAGFAARFDALAEQLAGEDDSLLSSRLAALAAKVLINENRIKFFNDRLDASRERLLLEFFNLELTIGRIQNNLSVIQSLNPIAPLASTRR